MGARVEVPPGRGVVRFCGTTSFSPGKWIGIELNEPNGKNDGTVQGVKYFTCRPGYGVFVRPSQVKVVADPPVAAVRLSVLYTWSFLGDLLLGWKCWRRSLRSLVRNRACGMVLPLLTACTRSFCIPL